MPLRIGLTGGIGSGKSTVAAVFELLGIPVYYADSAAKALYQSNPRLIKAVKKLFGEDIYQGGVLNRSALAEIVFADAEKLHQLNSLVHPLTIKDGQDWMARQTAPYAIKEAALLFESNVSAKLDYVIGVHAPVALRLQRVIHRDGLTADEIRQRMARQMNDDEKMKRCNFVITNDEELLVLPQVVALHEWLLMKANTE